MIKERLNNKENLDKEVTYTDALIKTVELFEDGLIDEVRLSRGSNKRIYDILSCIDEDYTLYYIHKKSTQGELNEYINSLNNLYTKTFIINTKDDIENIEWNDIIELLDGNTLEVLNIPYRGDDKFYVRMNGVNELFVNYDDIKGSKVIRNKQRFQGDIY